MPRQWRRIVGRTASIAVALLAVLLLAGASWEQWSRSRLPSLMPKTSRLVDVGDGRRIHLDCRGTGQPTVVFEAGIGLPGALYWTALQDSLAKVTRSCAYSRAGVLWSDPAPEAHNPDSMTADLHAALAAGGEQGPYLLVGYRAGVPLGLRYATVHRPDVAGIVMINAFHPEHLERMGKVLPMYGRTRPVVARVMAALARTGVTRLAVTTQTDNDVLAASVPVSITRVMRESEQLEEFLDVPAAARNLGDLPVLVLAPRRSTADNAVRQDAYKVGPEQIEAANAEYDRMQQELAAWSTRGRFEIARQLSPDATDAAPAALAEPISALVRQLRERAP